MPGTGARIGSVSGIADHTGAPVRRRGTWDRVPVGELQVLERLRRADDARVRTTDAQALAVADDADPVERALPRTPPLFRHPNQRHRSAARSAASTATAGARAGVGDVGGASGRADVHAARAGGR